MKKILKFIISIAIPLAIGYLGSIFTTSSVNSWYTTINKPSFNPPNYLFAPIWTALFVLIGISFYFVWMKKFEGEKEKVITIYFVQLLLNFLWSLFFFGVQSPALAFLDIIALWFMIVVNIIIFYRISKISGWMLVPYLLWVSFASALNLSIVILN